MTKRGSYKGNPTITLVGEFSDFTFGLTKARLILSNLEAIQQFVGAKVPIKLAPKSEGDVLDLPELAGRDD